jgi:hypothetical protein
MSAPLGIAGPEVGERKGYGIQRVWDGAGHAIGTILFIGETNQPMCRGVRIRKGPITPARALLCGAGKNPRQFTPRQSSSI